MINNTVLFKSGGCVQNLLYDKIIDLVICKVSHSDIGLNILRLCKSYTRTAYGAAHGVSDYGILEIFMVSFYG